MNIFASIESLSYPECILPSASRDFDRDAQTRAKSESIIAEQQAEVELPQRCVSDWRGIDASRRVQPEIAYTVMSSSFGYFE
ncbi:hypothetical protein [Trinickia sp. EG282A]|uniref:hypothetical protein n=1 Tax=Trinickia sp. EG282A TaxID=3237013 RepID=UPI0034D18318